LGFGSNQGERHENINRAVSFLKQVLHSTTIFTGSSIVETHALLKENSPKEWDIPFLNSVVQFETSLHFSEILSIIQEIERKMGKNFNAPAWSPRIIDIDILLFGDVIHNSLNLTIPHPQIQNRLFVLEPICEIASEAFHPILKKTCKELLKILKNKL
jgi:2-amino-4-hydroxy-6-hydroxymethyldihydropteridine diphosphokinase/dihydropteroate synthase